MDVPLDHNFPEPILRCLDEFIPDIRLLPLRQIHPALPRLGDRELLIALHQLQYSGLVTSNYKMLQNPRELAAVLKTKITVFAIEGVGHDPIRATGALLLDLPAAITAVTSGASGVFWLRPRRPQPQDPWELFQRAAKKRHEHPADLYDRSRYPIRNSPPLWCSRRSSYERPSLPTIPATDRGSRCNPSRCQGV